MQREISRRIAKLYKFTGKTGWGQSRRVFRLPVEPEGCQDPSVPSLRAVGISPDGLIHSSRPSTSPRSLLARKYQTYDNWNIYSMSIKYYINRQYLGYIMLL